MTASRSNQGRRRNGRQKLLEAAEELFSEKGYATPTTKEIADRADITEAMLFRHYGSKAALFMQVAAGPFREFLEAAIQEWEAHGLSGMPEEALRRHTLGLYESLASRREFLNVVLANFDSDAETVDAAQVAVNDVMDRWTLIHEVEHEALGLPDVYNYRVQTRLVFAMVLTVALHGEWLFGPDFDLDEVLDEITRLTIYGGGDYRATSMELARSTEPKLAPRRPHHQ